MVCSIAIKWGKSVRKRAMSEGKTDRRIERTRRVLQAALIELCVERGYGELTVQHIIDRANTSRSTFYAHYRDKADLFASSVENLGKGLMHQWKADIAAGKPKGQLIFVLTFLRHIDGNRHLWRVLIVGESGQIMREHFRAFLGELVRKDLGLRSRSEATVACVVGALMSLVEEWMEDRISGSPEEINRTFLGLMLPGIA